MDFRADLTAEIPFLRRFARALTGDPALADDLVQDCIERALVKSHLYDATRPLRAWLYAVLRNIHVSGLRRERRAGIVKTVDDLTDPEAALKPSQEVRVLKSDSVACQTTKSTTSSVSGAPAAQSASNSNGCASIPITGG